MEGIIRERLALSVPTDNGIGRPCQNATSSSDYQALDESVSDCILANKSSLALANIPEPTRY